MEIFHIATKALCRKNKEKVLSYALDSIMSLVEEPHEHELLERLICPSTVNPITLKDLESVRALFYRFTLPPYAPKDAPLDAIHQLASLAQSTSERLQALQEVSSSDSILTTLLSQEGVQEKVQKPLFHFRKTVLENLADIVIREASFSTEKDRDSCVAEDESWEHEDVVHPPVGQTALDYLKLLTGAEEALYTIATEVSNPDFDKQALEAYKSLLQKETDKKIKQLTREVQQ